MGYRFGRFAILNIHHLLYPGVDRIDETLHLFLGICSVQYNPEPALTHGYNRMLHREHAKRVRKQMKIEPPGVLLLRRHGNNVREKRTVLPTVCERHAEQSSCRCCIPERMRGERIKEEPGQILDMFLCLRNAL